MQVRRLATALERRTGVGMRRDHIISILLVIHAANAIHRYSVGQDGRTTYHRIAGNTCERAVVEFGEIVWALMPACRGVTTRDYMRYEGMWVGVVSKSGEHIVLTEEWGCNDTM